MRLLGLPLHQERPRSRIAGESPRRRSLRDFALKRKPLLTYSVPVADSSCRGLGSVIWSPARMNYVGVNQTDFYSLLAAALSQSWRSRFGTQAKPGRSSLAFTLRLFLRFFHHLCGRSSYASLRECTTALWHAKQSRSCMRKSIKFALASLE